MGDRLFRTTSTAARRSTGLLIAAALALIMAGIILWVAVGQSNGGKGTALPGNVVDIGKAPEPVAGSSDPNQIQASGAARLQFADKTDTNRLGSELAFDKIDPVGPGYYTLTQPRAWVYLKDGRTLHVRADTGRVKMPVKMQQPESGEFRGHVVLKMFPPSGMPKGMSVPPIDPEKDEAGIVGVTDSISFDTVLLELTTQDHVTIAAKNLLFEGDGLLVRANQVKERIELLKTTGQFVRYNPDVKVAQKKSEAKPAPAAGPATGQADVATASAASPDGKPEGTPGPASASPATAAATTSTGKEQLYKAVFGDRVEVTQTSRRLDADTLEVFARLINNSLPENALGVWEEAPAKPAKVEQAKGEPVAPVPASSGTVAAAAVTAPPTPATPKNEATALFVSGPEDMVLKWNGPLVLTPVADAPAELGNGNHFFARFSAEKAGGQTAVTLEDSASKAKGECSKIEYSATTRTLALLGGPDAPSVKFIADGVGRVTVPNVKVDLGTGIASVAGGGDMLAIRAPKPDGAPAPGEAEASVPKLPRGKANLLAADQLREISWTDQADFKFRTAAGRITGAMEMAKFEGTVIAHDRTSSISSDSMRVEFSPAPSPGTQTNTLRLMHAEGSVMAIAGPRTVDPDRAQPALDPYIACDTLDVAFAPSKIDPNDTDPVRGVARGHVKAANKDASVRADVLETAMTRDDKKAIVLAEVQARGGVSLERADGVRASAENVSANPVLRSARLTGDKVVIGKGPSQITGRDVELDDVKGIMRVNGQGMFEHTQGGSTQLAAGGEEPTSLGKPDATTVTATWKKGMLFNNTAGTIECVGESTVTAASSLRTQAMRSDKLNLWLTPMPPVAEASPGNAGAATPVAAGAASNGAAGTLAANTPAKADGTPASNEPTAPDGQRKLLRAEAIGASEEREGAPHATVEVRRYSPPPSAGAERVLDQVLYVEGPRIIADDGKGTITVPAAGRAIVRDQRAAGNAVVLATSSGLSQATTGGARGTSRFTWAESMEFTRATGTLTMKKDVELVHLPLGSQQVTRLVAMKMDARFNMQGGPNAPRSAELVSADATGAVYAESGTQRLLCDVFAYDAIKGTAEASAQGNNKVTLHDDKKGSPLVARKLFWDLVKDRVEIMEPAPITAPR